MGSGKAREMVDGYSVETTAVRCFRDTTLTSLAQGLPHLDRALAAAALPTDACPAVVADTWSTRASGLDSLQQRVRALRDNADIHIRDLGTVAGAYDQAEVFGTHKAVAAAFGSIGPSTASTDQAAGQHVTGTAMPRCTVNASPASEVGTQGGVTPAHVFTAFDGLTQLLTIVGLGSVIQPSGARLAATIRDPEPFRQAAAQLDTVRSHVDQLHEPIPAALNILDSYWAGPTSTAHRAATIDNYRPHFEAISAHARDQAAKDRQNASTQDTAGTVIYTVIIIAIALVSICLIACFAFLSTASAFYRIVMIMSLVIGNIVLISNWVEAVWQ